MADEASTCGAETNNGTQCKAQPFLGPRCALHQPLALTDRQVMAARRNAWKSGAFDEGLNEGEREAHARFELDSAELKEALVSIGVIRLKRAMAHELDIGKPSSHTTAAFNALQVALDRLPAKEPEHQCLDDDTIRKHVDVLLRDPELFLMRLEPAVAAKVRAVLREATAASKVEQGDDSHA